MIRHGETDWNRQGRLQGQHDIPLNPLGRDQAADAGRALKGTLTRRGLDPRALRFTASPLGRARDTMERVRIVLGLDPAAYGVEDRIKEISFGGWEGATWSELKTTDGGLVRARKRDKWHFVPPGGESYDQLAQRLAPWLATLDQDEVIVAHGGVARALMHMLAAVPQAQAPEVDIIQGRVLRFDGSGCRWL